jgi:hypothetical protein
MEGHDAELSFLAMPCNWADRKTDQHFQLSPRTLREEELCFSFRFQFFIYLFIFAGGWIRSWSGALRDGHVLIFGCNFAIGQVEKREMCPGVTKFHVRRSNSTSKS